MADRMNPLTVESEQNPADQGNALRSKMRLATLIGRLDVVGVEVAIMRLHPKEGEVFPFKAGQYATLALEVNGRLVPRAYSIASSPYTLNHLEFYINLIEEGQLTPALFDMRIGDDLYFMGPKGIFTLEKTKASHLVFVATGTGLAPFISMLRKLHADYRSGNPHGKILTVMHGVRHTEDLGYRDVLESIAWEKGFNLVYLPIVSRTSEDPLWTPELGKGRVTDVLSLMGEDMDGREAPVLPASLDPKAVFQRFPREDTAVYLCGNPEMTTEAKRILKEKGYAEVYTEDYW